MINEKDGLTKNDLFQRFVNHPLLKKDLIEWRDYQINISESACNLNTLVVLPTALGKTIIGLLTLVKILQKAPNSRILILAPTRPLVMQHYNSFSKFLIPKIKCCLFSSNLSPLKRVNALNDYQIFFSTPQIIQNDLKAGLYTLEGMGQIIFDEAHKARKKYAYTYVAKQYLEQCTHPLILALTASPGKNEFYINDLVETLQIEQIVFRNADSPDVKQYVFPINTLFRNITQPDEIMKAQVILDTAQRKNLDYLISHSILPKRNFYSKIDFIRLIQDFKILDLLTDDFLDQDDMNRYHLDYSHLNFPDLAYILETGEVDKSTIISKAVMGIYLGHLTEILTTQDVRMFFSYLNRLKERANNGKKYLFRLLNSKYILGIEKILRSLKKSPKIPELIQILNHELQLNPHTKIIVFTQYREMGGYIVNEINGLNSKLIAKRFVGQSSRPDDRGLTQTQQAELIRQFSGGIFNVLVATSVAEEGLDIPSVDAVIFYEAVPSEIRLIQRRGRTGRHEIGRCYCLLMENSLDTIYNRVSHSKEEKMQQLLRNPEKINLTPEIDRSEEMPAYGQVELNEIKDRVRNAKSHVENQKQKEIEKNLDTHTERLVREWKLSQKADVHLIQDITQELTRKVPARQDKMGHLSTTLNHPQMTKKIFNWIVKTMEILGTLSKESLACELDRIYQAAVEESMDMKRIKKEILLGVQSGVFEQTRGVLLYCFN